MKTADSFSSSQHPVSKVFRHDINGLRALAVLAVIAYHYGLPFMTGGFAGVDVFFVVSGFLITSQIHAALEAKKFSFQSFYISRLRRIFPALFFVCAASIAWGWFFVLPPDFRNFCREALSAILFVSNIAFAGPQGYFDLAANSKPLLHTWSLAVEGQFYFLLPIYLAAIWDLRPKRFATGLLIAALASFWYCKLEPDAVKSFYLLPGRSWEFLLGGLAGVMTTPKWGRVKANVLAFIALAGLLVGFIALDASYTWPGFWTLIPVSAVLTLLAAADSTVLAKFWKLWPIQRVGDLSYSLYLWHWPVLVYGRQYLSSPENSLRFGWASFFLILTLALSILTWKFVEQPIRQRRDLWGNKQVAYGSGVTAFGLFVFAAIVVAKQGLPERFPPYVQRAFTAVSIDTPRPDCFRDTASKKKSEEQFCSFGDNPLSKSPTMLLWGDSHANQYLEALSHAVQGKNIVGAVATQSECGPAESSGATELPSALELSCKRFNSQVSKFIVDTPSIKSVVIGRLWRSATSVDNTVALIRQLIAADKKIILVGPVPSGGFNVPSHWSQLQIQAGHAIDDVTVPSGSQENARQLWESVKMKLAEQIKTKNLIFIDPFTTLCDERNCYLVKDGTPVIRDTSHLSQAGALSFASQFSSAISQLD